VQGLSSQARRNANAGGSERRVPLIIRHATPPHPPPERVDGSKRQAVTCPWEGERGCIACFEVSTPIIVLISFSNRTRAIALINRVVVRGYLLITATGLPSPVNASSSKGRTPSVDKALYLR